MVAAHMHVGRQVGDDVVVTGRDEDADARPVALATQIERDDLRQRAIERRGELVDGEPLRPFRQRRRQTEPPALAVAQFTRTPQHQSRLGQSARRQQRRRPLEIEAERVDRRAIGEFDRLRTQQEIATLLQIRDHGAEQARLARAARSRQCDDLSRFDRQFQILRHDVRPFRVAQPELIGDQRRIQRATPRSEGPGDGEVHGK
ncbi:MAG: hypothetical protein WBC44_20865 [Planctomycetaceae bacterium]